MHSNSATSYHPVMVEFFFPGSQHFPSRQVLNFCNLFGPATISAGHFFNHGILVCFPIAFFRYIKNLAKPDTHLPQILPPLLFSTRYKISLLPLHYQHPARYKSQILALINSLSTKASVSRITLS